MVRKGHIGKLIYYTGPGGSQVPNLAYLGVFDKVVPTFLCPSDSAPRVVFTGSTIRLADVIDGASNSVLAAEAIRGDGLDTILPAGTTPTFPYRKVLSGSGTSPGTGPGYIGGSGGWPGGIIADPNLAAVSAAGTSWRGGQTQRHCVP